MSELPERAEDQAQVWLRFAQEDLMAARRAIHDEEVVFRIAGFLAQQSAEQPPTLRLVARAGTQVSVAHDGRVERRRAAKRR